MPSKRNPRYWLPRILLGLFALSLAFPLPRYLAGLEAGEFAIWLSQAAWVLGWVALLALIALLGRWWRGRRERRRGPGDDLPPGPV